ncbi:hypothetical protein [Streptomyces platensis]|uniref:hypothetical protein n=1 Tax=Streptomyces platensis TaxID=58346 RepID=UPI002E2546B2
MRPGTHGSPVILRGAGPWRHAGGGRAGRVPRGGEAGRGGRYRPLPRKTTGRSLSFGQALEDGHVSFWLDGSKLHGGYALTRFRTGEGPGKRESWLLVKENDDRAGRGGTPDARRARSVRSGRTLKRVAAEEGPGQAG